MDSLHFNWLDYIFLGLILLTMLSGFSRGLFKEILSLVTLVVAFIVASYLCNDVASYISHTDSVQEAMSHATPETNQSLSMLSVGFAFTLIFVGVVILGSILSFILNIAFSKNILGMGNRLLGGIFGILKGVGITLALVFVIQLTAVGDSEVWHESRIVAELQPAVEHIGKVASPTLANLKDRFEKSMKKITEEQGAAAAASAPIEVPVQDVATPVATPVEEGGENQPAIPVEVPVQ